MRKNVKTVPLKDLGVGQWFYLRSFPQGTVMCVTEHYSSSQGFLFRLDGGRLWGYTKNDHSETLPVEGPHVTYEEALEAATEIVVPEPVPGLKFEYRDGRDGPEIHTIIRNQHGGHKGVVYTLIEGEHPPRLWWFSDGPEEWAEEFEEGCIRILEDPNA